MLIPEFDWKPFDKSRISNDLIEEKEYLILLRTDNYDNGATWSYHVDVATPYGSYIDDFWNTTNDWCEGQRVEVVSYAEIPYYIYKENLKEV